MSKWNDGEKKEAVVWLLGSAVPSAKCEVKTTNGSKELEGEFWRNYDFYFSFQMTPP